MICVQQNIEGLLEVIDLSPNEECQFIELVEQSQLDSPLTLLTPDVVGALFIAAAGLYALSFVFKMALQQLGYR